MSRRGGASDKGIMRPIARRTLQVALVLLFAFQAIRAFFAALFGQAYDAVFLQRGLEALRLAVPLVLFIVLLPLLANWLSQRTRRALYASAVLCALARIPMSLGDPTIRMVSAGLTLALAGLYLSGLSSVHRQQLLSGLLLAVIADQILRALGHTYDPSLSLWWLPVQAVLALGLIWLTRGLSGAEEAAATSALGTWDGVGFGATLFLLASLLALPNAAARWTESDYTFWVIFMISVPLLRLWSPVASWLARYLRLHARTARVLVLATSLIGLYLGYVLTRVPGAIGLTLALLAYWSLLPGAVRLRARHSRVGVSAAMLTLLALGTLHAFTFTYAYTFDRFRDAGLPVFLVAMTIATGPSLFSSTQTLLSPLVFSPTRSILTLSAIALVGLGFYIVGPEYPLVPSTERVRIGTYNIHYGFDEQWLLSLEQQAETIIRSGADIVALQEVDTGRLTSYGIDQAWWLARRLNMHAVFLPTVEHTTGITLLTRMEPLRVQTALLPSQGEQTGIIRGVILVDGREVGVHAFWLGLTREEREVQLQAAMEVIGVGPAALAGDLNFEPGDPEYETMLAHGFVDPFAEWPPEASLTAPASAPRHRIDYVWLRNMEPEFALVLDSLASDHRMIVVMAQ